MMLIIINLLMAPLIRFGNIYTNEDTFPSSSVGQLLSLQNTEDPLPSSREQRVADLICSKSDRSSGGSEAESEPLLMDCGKKLCGITVVSKMASALRKAVATASRKVAQRLIGRPDNVRGR